MQNVVCFLALGSPRTVFGGVGATFHFRNNGNYDRLTEHGRWAQVATARMHVDLAMADAGSAELTTVGLEQAQSCKWTTAFPNG